MNDGNKRFKELRGIIGLSQEAFGEAMGLSKSGISNIENGIRKVTDQHIKLICSEFNVSEEWLRNGTGDMFVRSETFSLDEKAQKNNLTDLEIDIIQSYMELNKETRSEIIGWIRSNFERHAETAATVEVDPIEKELEDYRRELEAEKKGRTLSASPAQSEPS